MKKYIVMAGLMFSVSGCGLLELDESTGLTREEAYAYFNNVKGLVTYVYSRLPDELGGLGGALRESATDNSVYIWSDNSVHTFYNNAWNPVNTVDDVWGRCYGAIRSCNSFLENYSPERLERFRWNDTYDEDISKANMYRQELRVLRAFFFFELAKRYGDIPLLTRTYTTDEINNVEKTAFHEVVNFICAECDEAAQHLPVRQKDFWAESGRVTKGTAQALKARALLYAASPLHNAAQEASRWEAAAKAAYALIKEGNYSLPQIDKDPLYHKDGGNEVLKSSQLIFERRSGDTFDYEANNLPISYEKGKTGNVPTQNLVDAFQMADGRDFDWATLVPGDNAYRNRDPRFYHTVLCNGDTWMQAVIEAYEGGKDGAGTAGTTKTGYYLKKYMNETVSLIPTKERKKPHHYVLFRYAEVLLNYAEAMNAWRGADYTDATFSLSARAALNQVRSAAKMPPVTAVGDAFTESIRRERRVELAFEDHRFWDIRRWKIGESTKDIYCVRITLENGNPVYKRELLETRSWDEKMNLYPIPQAEYLKNNNLGQNKGWQ